MNILVGLWFIIGGGWIIWTTIYVLLSRHNVENMRDEIVEQDILILELRKDIEKLKEKE